jgi:hypothetical protein
MPKRALILLAAALLSWLAAAAFIFRLDPEVDLGRKVLARKRAWAMRCDGLFPQKTVVYGGSSCAFSIDGQRLEDRFGRPTVNMALGAGLGPAMLTNLALPACREGDTLIVALEPGLITTPFKPLMSATHLAYAMGERGLLFNPARLPGDAQWPGELFTLRPDATRTVSILGKLLTRQPMYRYKIEEVEPSGYQWTEVRVPISGPPDQGPHLSDDARALFAHLRQHAAAHRLTLRYSLPWCFSAPELAAGRRSENIALIREIQRFTPVLRDPALGVQTDREWFADTPHHLSRAAAQTRTDSLGEQLKADAVWEEGALANAAAGLP